ncbi:transmembrane protein 171-like [Spea bombifrons]|uniref:transmembrane protein 171-like n=1 Tax=Spea bombifrons TaxID=233779 RepID=UPI002349C434|nr:transmembrane protein 171-like [Spea bombifrons]
MAEFTARQDRRRRESTGDHSNPDSRFLHGKSRQFVQFLTLGILFVGCGILIAIPGVVVSECKPVPKTATAPGFCENRSLQISGLVIAAVGLFFCLLAHMTRNHLVDDVPESEEEPRDQPFSIMLEGEVYMFPPPPPPYFPRGCNMPTSEDPPPYYSMYNKTYNDESSRRAREAIPLPSSSTNEGFPSEPPPSYTELYPPQPEPADN